MRFRVEMCHHRVQRAVWVDRYGTVSNCQYKPLAPHLVENFHSDAALKYAARNVGLTSLLCVIHFMNTGRMGSNSDTRITADTPLLTKLQVSDFRNFKQVK
jgi:hypothetical protein